MLSKGRRRSAVSDSRLILKQEKRGEGKSVESDTFEMFPENVLKVKINF